MDAAYGWERLQILESLNNDGVDDIVVTDYKSGDFLIYYMNENGLLSVSEQKIGIYSYGITVCDMDGDGKKDIMVTSSADNTVSIFYKNKGCNTE